MLAQDAELLRREAPPPLLFREVDLEGLVRLFLRTRAEPPHRETSKEARPGHPGRHDDLGSRHDIGIAGKTCACAAFTISCRTCHDADGHPGPVRSRGAHADRRNGARLPCRMGRPGPSDDRTGRDAVRERRSVRATRRGKRRRGDRAASRVLRDGGSLLRVEAFQPRSTRRSARPIDRRGIRGRRAGVLRGPRSEPGDRATRSRTESKSDGSRTRPPSTRSRR